MLCTILQSKMGTAATAKRPIKATKRPSGGGAKSAAHLGVERKKNGNIICAPTNASLSEKRRVAALISWEKRRINAEKRANKAAPKRASSKTSSSSTSKKNKKKSNAAPIIPRSKANANAAKKTTDMFRSKNSVVLKANKSKPKGKKNISTKSLTSIRREAARLGWERRKNSESSAGSSTSDASSGDEGSSSTTSSTASKKKKKQGINYSASARRQAAILGWQKRNSAKAKVPKSKKQDDNDYEDPSEARRRAAKLGWERRAKRLAAESSSAASSDASSGEDDERSSGDESSTRKIHDRRQAAILGWQRRMNEREAAKRDSTSSLTSDDIMSIVTTAAPKEKPRKVPPQRKETKQYREGTKRSRRLAEDPAETLTYEEETKKINELVTYLRVTRGWMEFQPSSRHGSGTATHGYIPSSLATYIRDGTINQSTVLGLGTLGIHYALDWEGYGGLRDMIATFGEDYSPYPTEEMMEQSRVPEWELGEDLPWREVEEAEETKLNEAVAVKEKEMAELIGLANILANMDYDAVVEEAEQEKLEQEKRLEQERLEEEEQTGCMKSDHSSLALKSYESSNNNSSNEDNSGNEDEDNNKDDIPLKTPVKKDEPSVHDDILIISKNVNNRSPWNFGLC